MKLIHITSVQTRSQLLIKLKNQGEPGDDYRSPTMIVVDDTSPEPTLSQFTTVPFSFLLTGALQGIIIRTSVCYSRHVTPIWH